MPDNFMYWVSAYIRGNDSRIRSVRTRIARYCILAYVMAMRSISVRIFKRFPTIEHVEVAGLMTKVERLMYEEVKMKFHPHGNWFLPLNWVQSLLMRERTEDLSHEYKESIRVS